MPEPIIYIRGSPSRLVGFADNPDALADLGAVAGLSLDQVTEIHDRLARATGFLGPRALAAAIRDLIPDDNSVRAVQRVLQNLDPADVKRLLDALSERRKKPDFPLNEDTLTRLGSILPTLVQRYPAVARFEKADRLAELTGQQLESVDLICDLRPVFDENRERLEGMMPYTRLRVVATGADGLPNSFEAALTRQQVHDLADKASKAKNKLDILHKSVETWIPGGLPDLPLTRIPRKESSDA
jgi:hypothetical protein